MTELGRVQRTCEERERLVGLLLDNNIPLDRVERDTAALTASSLLASVAALVFALWRR